MHLSERLVIVNIHGVAGSCWPLKRCFKPVHLVATEGWDIPLVLKVVNNRSKGR
jgi:hypothetical protein